MREWARWVRLSRPRADKRWARMLEVAKSAPKAELGGALEALGVDRSNGWGSAHDGRVATPIYDALTLNSLKAVSQGDEVRA